MEHQFDVFISKNSKDELAARKLSELLQQRGLRVFESSISLSQMGQAEYSDAIDDALNNSRHLLVICSRNENGEKSEWVRYEWQSFRNEVFSGRKKGNIVVIRLNSIPIANLAFGLRKYQAFDYQNLDMDGLVSYFRVNDDFQNVQEDAKNDLPEIEEADTGFAEENMSEENTDENGSADRIIKLDDLSFRMVFVEGGVINGRIVDPFYIGQFPVTQNIWEHVMGNNPSSNQESEYFKVKKTARRIGKVIAGTALLLTAPVPTAFAVGGIDGLSKLLKRKKTDECGHYPVEMVNNFDAVRFVDRLSELTGLSFSLPTEVEWQFAARGGRKSRGFKYAGSDNIDDVAWYGVNAGGITHPVGEKLPNELGLYDMSGNVWEWTLPESSRAGVRMGGSWSRNAEDCEVSHRDFLAHRERTSGSGLRVVLHDGKKGFNKE